MCVKKEIIKYGSQCERKGEYQLTEKSCLIGPLHWYLGIAAPICKVPPLYTRRTKYLQEWRRNIPEVLQVLGTTELRPRMYNGIS